MFRGMAKKKKELKGVLKGQWVPGLTVGHDLSSKCPVWMELPSGQSKHQRETFKEHFKESTSSSGPQKCVPWNEFSFSLPETPSSLDAYSVLLMVLSESHLPTLIHSLHFSKNEVSDINNHLILLKVIQLLTFLRIKTQILKLTCKYLSCCLAFQSCLISLSPSPSLFPPYCTSLYSLMNHAFIYLFF